MMDAEQTKRLDDLIGGRAEGLIEHTSAVIQFLETLDDMEQQAAIVEILTRFKRPEQKKEVVIQGEKMSPEDLKQLNAKLGLVIEATANYILTNRMGPEKAAEEIKRLLDGRPEMDEKIFCMAAIMGSNIVPYAVVPEFNLRLSNEEYQDQLKGLGDEISKIRIASGISKNASDMADLILSIIEEESEREKKVALLSYFIILRERTVIAGQQADQEQAPIN